MFLYLLPIRQELFVRAATAARLVGRCPERIGRIEPTVSTGVLPMSSFGWIAIAVQIARASRRSLSRWSWLG
jgi:hypothetical protein